MSMWIYQFREYHLNDFFKLLAVSFDSILFAKCKKDISD